MRTLSAQWESAGHFGTEEVLKAVGFPVCVWLVAAFPGSVHDQCHCHPIRFRGPPHLRTVVSLCSELPLHAAVLPVFYFPISM